MYSKKIIIESIIGKTTSIKYIDKVHQSDKGVVELQVDLKSQNNSKVFLDDTHLVSFMFVDAKNRLHQHIADRFVDGSAMLIIPEEVILTGGNVRLEIRFSKEGQVLGSNSVQFPIDSTSIKDGLITDFNPSFDIMSKMIEIYEAYDSGEIRTSGIKTEVEKTKEIARNYREGALVDTFNKQDWATMVGNVTSDSFNVLNGKESIRLQSSTAGEQPFIRSSRTLKLQGGKNIVLNVFLHVDPNDVDGISLFLSNNTAFTNMMEHTFPSIALVKGWNRLVIPFNRMTVTGTGSIANDFVRVQIRVIATSGKIADITVDSLIVNTSQKANVIFTFDDQWDTQYSVAFNEMRMRGLRGTIGVNGVNVGVPNYMTWQQLEEVYGYGWDLVNHTNEHYNLGQQSYDVQKKDIIDGKSALDSRGFTRASNILFLPYGSWNDITMQILTEEKIEFCRTIREQIETTPPIYNNKLKVKNLLPYLSASSAQSLVDDAIATGGTIIFLNHRIGVEDASNMFWDTTKFQTLLNYVKTKEMDGSINVLTISEWIETF